MKNGVEDFVVESTPVLDLKKHGLSSVSPTASPTGDLNWDSDRTEVYSDADGESAIASLIGEHGESFPITTFPYVIGRGSECDLVLQGKGVSRRHAEIIFQSGRFVVNDLESLNGIKVNGYKVSRVILEENDNVRLGEVALIFKSSSSAQSAGKKSAADTSTKSKLGGLFDKRQPASAAVTDDTFGSSPLKKIALNVVALVCVVIVGLSGYQYWNSQHQSTGRIVEASPSTASPAAPAPPPVAAPSKGTGNVSQVDGQSIAAPVIAEPTGSGDFVTANPDASVEPPPSLSPPPSIAKTPASVPAKAASVSRAIPPKSEPVVVQTRPTPAVNRTAQSQEKGRAFLANAQDQYFKGDAEAAIATAKSLLDDASVPANIRGDAKTAYTNYSTLYNQYSIGQVAYSRGDKESAFQAWVSFMDKEAALFGGRKSSYTQSISARVVGEYVSLGNEASKSGDHHRAYRMWQKALELGDNVAARIAIDNANNRAMQLYRQALRLEYVNTSKAKALWQEVTQLLPPGTEYNTKASAKLAWYDKWGT